MSVRELLLVGWLLSILLQIVLAVRLAWLGGWRKYPAVLFYLLFSTLAGAVGAFLLAVPNARSLPNLDSIVHVVSRPIIWLLFFAVAHELFSRLAENYQGLRRVGRLLLYGAIGSVAAIVLTVTVIDPYAAPELNHFYRLWLVQEQSVYLAMAVSFAAIVLVRRFFALPMSHNLRVLLLTLGTYFIGTGVMIVLRSVLGSSFNRHLDLAGLVLYCVCLAVGAVAFSRHGEAVAQDRRLTDSSGSVEALTFAARRLEHVNGQLLKALAK